jgi:hypothetical protein
LRGGMSRSAFVRQLLEAAGPTGAAGMASPDEALALLTGSARSGKVNAQIALARLLHTVNEGKPPAAADPFDAAAHQRLRVVRSGD